MRDSPVFMRFSLQIQRLKRKMKSVARSNPSLSARQSSANRPFLWTCAYRGLFGLLGTTKQNNATAGELNSVFSARFSPGALTVVRFRGGDRSKIPQIHHCLPAFPGRILVKRGKLPSLRSSAARVAAKLIRKVGVQNRIALSPRDHKFSCIRSNKAAMTRCQSVLLSPLDGEPRRWTARRPGPACWCADWFTLRQNASRH
jgi:hypothetical protein